MTSAWLALRNVHPALLCCKPVGASLAIRQLSTNTGHFRPVHLSRCGPMDSDLSFARPKDLAFTDCSGAQRDLNSP